MDQIAFVVIGFLPDDLVLDLRPWPPRPRSWSTGPCRFRSLSTSPRRSPAQRHALDQHSAQDDRERSDQDEVVAGKALGNGERHGQDDDAAHAGPAQHHVAGCAERRGALETCSLQDPGDGVGVEHPGEARQG